MSDTGRKTLPIIYIGGVFITFPVYKLKHWIAKIRPFFFLKSTLNCDAKVFHIIKKFPINA